MTNIILKQGTWSYDEQRPLGKPGGFGAVFDGNDAGGAQIAVKRLHVTANEAAHREIRIADELAGKSFTNVMPVLDAGEYKGHYYVVMPRAERSLQDEIKLRTTIPERESAEILLQIATGLSEVAHIIHRDLKPANVLLHEQSWKIADFGIARFVEETTSLRTLKDCLTYHYAAPEQWLYQTPTNATDVYALGCIGYALITGEPPFSATTVEELMDQHLHNSPPALSGVKSTLQSALYSMLRKTQGARIRVEIVKQRLVNLLDSFDLQRPSALKALAQADSNIAHSKLAEDAEKTSIATQEKARSSLAVDGESSLNEIIELLMGSISENAPGCTVFKNQVRLGQGQLAVSKGGRFQPGIFRESKWDVVLGTTISVSQTHPVYVWSSSLWYAKMPGADQYRWYEISFWSWSGTEKYVPFDLTQKPEHADYAIAPILHTYSPCFGPVTIDEDSTDEFIERWCFIFAKAAEGRLTRPSVLPVHKEFWK